MDTVSTGCWPRSWKEEFGEISPEMSQGDQRGGEDVCGGDRPWVAAPYCMASSRVLLSMGLLGITGGLQQCLVHGTVRGLQ